MFFIAIVLITTGASTMVYEVVLIREFTVILGSSFYASAVVLSSIMTGLSLGAYTFGRLSDRYDPLKLLFTLEVSIAMISTFIVQLTRTLSFDWEILIPLSFLIPLFPAFLMGGELPIAIKIVSESRNIGEASGFCYSIDTIGGIIGALVSGFFLIPCLGSLRTVLTAGVLNTIGALTLAGIVRSRLKFKFGFGFRVPVSLLILVVLSLSVTFVYSQAIEYTTQSEIYDGFYILEYRQTKHQTIVVAYHPILGKCLFLDGSLQISEVGNPSYSESLVLPSVVTLLSNTKPIRVLVIGGGDLGVVEVLTRFSKEEIQNITLVDLDLNVVEVSKKHLRSINRECWKDERVEIIESDCRSFVKDAKKRGERYDLVIVDLPDPKDDLSATMYSLEFYNSLYEITDEDGMIVTQATSADFALGYKAYAVIVKTVNASKFEIVRPYIRYVPGFGMWGFVLASKRYDPLKLNCDQIEGVISGIDVKTYDSDTHFAMFSLPPWLEREIEMAGINTLDSPKLIVS